MKIQNTARKATIKRKSCLWGMLVGLILLTCGVKPTQAESISGVQISVLESTPQAIIVELTTGSYEVEQLTHAGEIFHRIHMEGAVQTDKPGMPQVPTRGAMLGIPTTDGITLEIVEATYDTLFRYRLSPASLQVADEDLLTLSPTGVVHESFLMDLDSYEKDVYYPAAPVELGQAGYMRDQAITQVQFYPVQFNPVRNEVRIYHRILVKITWSGDVRSANADERYLSPDYETLLSSTLLNYETLQRPVLNAGATRNLDNLADTQSGNSVTLSDAASILKIGINESGIYRISHSDLVGAGFNLSITDPRLLKMSNQGQEIAIYVQGQEDGVFNEADYILFYGIAMNDAYTKENVYWLSVGSDVGHRMAMRDGFPAANTPSLDRFLTTVHAEEDTVYWQYMPGQAGDRWFWETRLSPSTEGLSTSRIYKVEVGQLYTGDVSASVRVKLKGFTKSQHHTRIYLNGKPIDDQTWYGQVEFIHEAAIPQSFLHTGINEIEIETIDTGASLDQLLVNWIEIDSWDTFNTQTNELWFSVPESGQQKFAVHGFTSSDIHILDVSDPITPVRITGAAIDKGDNHYSAIFTDNVQSSNRYIVFSSEKFRSPGYIVADHPSTWKSPNNGADYIIITHESFYDRALALAEHRSTSGLRVATVLIQDLYDEFNNGIFNPAAIRDFLSYAYQHWRAPAPTYVVLIGDANQDYKDNLKNGTINYVPSQNIVIDGSGEVSSDNWFVAINGNDNLPDMFIGRLVTQSNEEASAIVEKIINYDQNPPNVAWNKNVLLVATDEEPMFLDLSEQIAARLPYYYQINRIYVNNDMSSNPRADIINQINNGALLVNYAGHGWYFGWGRLDNNIFFDNSAIDSLNNSRLPIVTVGNCLNGFFAGPKDKPSLAEVFLRRKNAGAVAVWAPSSFGDVLGHRVLLRNFYEAVFWHDQQTLGAATTAAKFATFAYATSWGELIETYVLFGDPATKLGIPPNFPYLRGVSPGNEAEGVALDQHIELVFNKPVDPQTITISSVGSENLQFEPSWNSNFTVAGFSHLSFAHGKKYQLTVNGQDRLENPIGPGIAPNPWSFTVTKDDVAPSGGLAVQGGEQPFVITTASLNIRFSERVRANSVTYSITPSVKGSLFWDNSEQQAIFLHERFKETQTYTFAILTAKDIAGNSLSEPFQVTFTVGKTFYFYLPSIFD